MKIWNFQPDDFLSIFITHHCKLYTHTQIYCRFEKEPRLWKDLRFWVAQRWNETKCCVDAHRKFQKKAKHLWLNSMIHLKSEASDFTNSRSSDAWWKWKCAKNSQFLKHLLTHCIEKAAVSVYSPKRFTCVWLFQAKSMSKSIACNQKALNQFENRSEMNETLETDQRVCMDFDLLDLNTDQSNSTSNGHSCDSMGTGLSWTIHTQAYTPNTATEWEIVTLK